jgi:hypothetical protein
MAKTAYQLWQEDQDRKKKQAQLDASQGKINFREASQTSRPQYTLPGYQGQSETKNYDWETSILGGIKGKGIGRSNNDKFDYVTKRLGMTPGQSEDFRNFLDFQYDSQQSIKTNKDGTVSKGQNVRPGQGALLKNDVMNGIFNNMNKRMNNDIQAKQQAEIEKAKQQLELSKQVSKERNGLLGFLDSTFGRVGNAAHKVFGEDFVNAENQNYANLAADKLKKNPKDKHSIEAIQMLNNTTRSPKNGLEKASDFIGTSAGELAPYTIGGAYGAADALIGQTALKNPIAKDLIRGAIAGTIAGTEKAAVRKVASNQDTSPLAVLAEAGMAGGGDAVLGGLMRNLNLKGQLNEVLKGTKSQAFNEEEFQKALQEAYAPKGDISNVIADPVKQVPPIPQFTPKYSGTLNPKSLDSFVPNEIPKVDVPATTNEWLNFAQSGQVSKARGSFPKANVGQYTGEMISKQGDNILNQTDALKNAPEGGYNQRLLDIQKEMQKTGDKRGIYRPQLSPDELYLKVKGPNDPKTFDDLIKLAEMENNKANAPVNIKTLLRNDPRIADAIKKLNQLGGKPKETGIPGPDIPTVQSYDEMMNSINQQPKTTTPNGINLNIPKLPDNLTPAEKLQQFLNSIKKNDEVAAAIEPSAQKSLKAGRDYEPITAGAEPIEGNFGNKLINSEKNPNPFDHPYQPGDTLPNTIEQIGTKTEKDPVNVKAAVDTAYTKTVDNLHRLEQFDKQVEEVLGRRLNASESTHTLGLNSRGSDMISKQILTENMVDKNGEVIGQSLNDITMKVPKGRLKEFEDYLINLHAITRMERGEKVFPDEMQMTPDKSRAIVAKYEEQHPEFKEIANEYYQYNKQLGQKWLVDTGILSKEQWEGYLEANPHYVPNNRIFSDIERPLFYGAKKGFGNQSNPIKKAIGSQRKIVSPIESTIEHTAQYVKTAKRNEVMQTLINNIKQDPEAFQGWAEIIPTENGAGTFLDSIGNKLKNEGIDGVLDEFNKAFDQKVDLTKGNVVRGLIDGKPVHVKVHDPALLDALTNLQPKAQNVVIHALGKVTRIMKNLTTGVNPVFSLTRNIFRDIPTAFTNSKSTNNPFVFSKDLVQSVVSVIKNDELYRSFKAVGGGHASPISSDANLLAQSKRSILSREKGLWVGTKHYGGKVLGALENLNNAVEAAPRLAEFKRIAGDSYDSKMKALYEANDVTVNFNKYGNVAKEIDSVIPYFNAAVQGLDKTWRTFISPSATAAEKTAAGVKAFASVTIPSIIMFSINHDDPNYQKVSNYIKDTNFLIPKGDGTFIKIPKPRELGVVFGSDVERVLRMWADQDPNAFKDFTTTIWDNFKPPVRTIAAPFFDLRANKNFMDAPIIPGDLEGVSRQYQYDSKTSELSKKLGSLFGVSPMNSDYIIKSYGGVLGELGLPLMTKNNSVGQTLKQKVTVDPVFSNDIQKSFYDTKTKLDQAYNNLNKQGVRTENLNESLRKMLNKKSLDMGKIRKRIKEVQVDNSLSSDERLKQIRVLQEQINQIAAIGNQIAR